MLPELNLNLEGVVTVVEGLGEIAGRNSEGYEVKVDRKLYWKRLLIATGSML